ncbi:MAG: SNF2-related protein, partial [Verrucomicrobiota bacterium]
MESSGIRDFLESGAWRDRFEEEILLVATKLRPRVKALRGQWEAGDQFTLHAEVSGETCEVIFWPEGSDWAFESQCTCEIRSYCPHAAAILLAAIRGRKLQELLEPQTTATPAAGSTTSHSAPGTRHSHEVGFHLRVTREPTESKVVKLLLQALKIPDPGEWVVARPEVTYGDYRTPLGGKPGLREHPLPDGSVLLRDTAAEMNAILQLQQLGLASLSSHPQYRFLLALEKKSRSPQTNAPAPSASALWFPDPAHGELSHYWPWLRTNGAANLESTGWTVAFDEEVGHEVIAIDPDAFKYVLENDGQGWFNLSVGFDVGGRELDLLPILAQLLDRGASEASHEVPAQGNFLHHLDDGRALKLPADRIQLILRQFSALLDPRRFKGSKLRLHPLDAATLSSNDPQNFDPPPELGQLIRSLSSPQLTNHQLTQSPAGLQATLRSYQKDGFHWLQFLTSNHLHGILADDMGLGKTLQTITHILAEKESGRSGGSPTLVVAPTSVVPNWHAEIKRFAPSLSVLILEGPKRKKYFRSIPHADVVLTSYALLQRDMPQLRQFSYHLAILD